MLRIAVVAPGCDEYTQWFEKIFNRDAFIARIMKISDYDPRLVLTRPQMDILLYATTGLVKFAASKEDLLGGAIPRGPCTCWLRWPG